MKKYEYRFCADGQKLVEYLNSFQLTDNMRVLHIHTTDAGQSHVFIERDKHSNE